MLWQSCSLHTNLFQCQRLWLHLPSTLSASMEGFDISSSGSVPSDLQRSQHRLSSALQATQKSGQRQETQPHTHCLPSTASIILKSQRSPEIVLQTPRAVDRTAWARSKSSDSTNRHGNSWGPEVGFKSSRPCSRIAVWEETSAGTSDK